MLWLCRKFESSALFDKIPSTFSWSMFSVLMGFVDGLVNVGRVGEGGVGGDVGGGGGGGGGGGVGGGGDDGGDGGGGGVGGEGGGGVVFEFGVV